MPFYLSPSVNVFEKDLTTIVPAVSTSIGAFAGAFPWGPILDPVTVSSENVLVQRFGKPTNGNFTAFFTAANFLSYSNNLLLIRADAGSLRNAVATLPSGVTVSPVKIKNEDEYETQFINGSADAGPWAAKYAGTLGNSLKVSMADSGSYNVWEYKDEFDGPPGTTDYVRTLSGQNDGLHIAIIDEDGVWTGSPGAILEKYPFVSKASDAVKSDGSNNYYKYVINNQSKYIWWLDHSPVPRNLVTTVGITGQLTFTAGSKMVIGEPTQEEEGQPAVSPDFTAQLRVGDVLKTSDGTVLGTVGLIIDANNLELTANSPSNITDIRNVTRTRTEVVNNTNWGAEAQNVSFVQTQTPITNSLSGGQDDYTGVNAAKLQEAYDIFNNDELYDISLVLTGKMDCISAKYVIENLVEKRRDCVAFISPVKVSDNSVIQGNGSDAVEDIIEYRNNLPSTSYAIMDTGFKYQYDRYNDVYRWVPLNGDVAGLCARTDYTNDAWWSPAGYNRGQIKSVVKLAVNPAKTERDNLYKKGINPVVNFPGNGVVLFGDKTLLTTPSAFDRINVRRLFIVLEKAIATAAKYQLFEFNDGFTRAQFRNLVEPFLRDVQGRRGIIDFRVKCDESNNTGEVIDRNEFIADIFIKPTRSINFITLNFIAARTGISFEEIGA